MKIFKHLICLVVVAGAIACRTVSQPNKDGSDGWITGTVKYIQLEGGFYGILGDQGDRFDPVNLPESFKQDGFRVKFQMEKLPNQMSFHMWGKLVTITDIERL
jgi:hypothetical protein